MRGLCHRCENRVRYLELEEEKEGSGHAPRAECKGNYSVMSCYAFEPTKPLVLEKSELEKRLEKKTGIDRGLGGYFGGRLTACEEQPEFEVIATEIEKGKWLVENVLKEEK